MPNKKSTNKNFSKFFCVYSLLTVALIVLHSSSKAQGCSDAGFCSISSLQPQILHDTQKIQFNQINVGVFYGLADYDIQVWGQTLTYQRMIGKKVMLDAKFNSLAQQGNAIHTYGPGDIFCTGSYSFTPRMHGVLGIKLPLTPGNRTRNNRPLPMDYQSSLGTLDVMMGVRYQWKDLQLMMAIQKPLTQNKNQFDSLLYPLGNPLRNFTQTSSFKRQADIMLRISYPIPLHRTLRFTPGLLPIYHIGNDTYRDANNMQREISGSKGLTLNGNLFLDYQIARAHAIQFNAGMPFIVRKTRPDGLTRSLIMSVEYRFSF